MRWVFYLDHRASGGFIIDILGGKPPDEWDSSRRSADVRPWMDFEGQQTQLL
jgi:hypothetical protein